MKKELLKRLNEKILATPTGELRELLTDLAIYLKLVPDVMTGNPHEARDGTNLSEEITALFEAIRNPEYANFGLFSCFVDGEPSAAIISMHEKDEDSFMITPLFVLITDKMVLTDHDGVEASRND